MTVGRGRGPPQPSSSTTGPTPTPRIPDHPSPGGGNPPSYAGVRTATYTYVEYVTGDREYYDRVRDPLELHNAVGQLSPARLEALHGTLLALTTCRGSTACTAARSAG